MIDDILIRDATDDDMPFFWSSVMNHYRHSSPHVKLIPDCVYFDCHYAVLQKVLNRKGNVLKFAVLASEPDVILGFLWGNEAFDTVHYIYVKKAFRQLGIGRVLFNHAFENHRIFYTHATYDGGKITHKYRQFIFNPYLLNGDVWSHCLKLIDEGQVARENLFRPQEQTP